ncbi:MAG: winged helix-turn-helix transcriptional regulator [Candidatus Hodarchaeota archaeon]
MAKSGKNLPLPDKLSLRIIASLIKDPQKPISSIAKEIGTSRATIRKRLKNLTEEGWIRLQLGLNSRMTDLQQGVLFFILADAMDIGVLFNRLENCPRVVSVLTHVGRYHAIAFLVAETTNNLLYTTECLQAQIKTRDVNFVRLSSETILFPKFTVLKIFPMTDLGPCGRDCLECIRYIKKQCDGCPGSSRFRKSTSLLNLGRYQPPIIKSQKSD